MVKYTIGDALRQGIALLKENKIESASLDAGILLCHVLGCDKLYLTVHRDDVLSAEYRDLYDACLRRRCQNEPVSYITGVKEFMSLDFRVQSGVLIPRPDTEVLVERVISELSGLSAPVIIDMCTGSGAIAVSLGYYIKGARVTALDVSDCALKLAKKNAEINGVDITVAKHDVLMPYAAKADAVVSNPPYIPTADVDTLEADVRDYEPHLALDGGSDGLCFYRAIIENISHSLKKGGLLAFEVGCGLAPKVKDLMETCFDRVTVEKDIAGIDRVVYGYYMKSVM